MLSWDPRALAVLERLRGAGFRTVLVGGCVRDSLLSVPPHDYDIATAARPEQVLELCRDFPCVETGLRHGTVTVISQNLPVEVTTFRREGDYTDHRRPDKVTFTDDLTEDLARRDFTINAMAWEPEGLADPFGGRQDLERRLIRCVGDPDRRFDEDALRPLRGLRLAAQLDFFLEENTAAALRRHIPQLSYVAWERISAEFVRLLCSPAAPRILLEYPQAAVQILPELGPTVGFDQRNPHHCYDVYAHSVKALSQVPPRPALRLAALLHDVGKPPAFTLDEAGVGHFYGHPKISALLGEKALGRLRLDKATQERTLTLIARHDLPVEPTRRWVGRWLARLGPDTFFDLMALKRADGLACAMPGGEREQIRRQAEELARTMLEEKACFTLKDLAVNGHDAMAAGLRGPEIGRALRDLLDQVAQGELPNEREVLLSRLKK